MTIVADVACAQHNIATDFSLVCVKSLVSLSCCMLSNRMPFICIMHLCTHAGTKKLFKMMLGTDSEFVNKFFQARKYWDINIGQWTATGTHQSLPYIIDTAIPCCAYSVAHCTPADHMHLCKIVPLALSRLSTLSRMLGESVSCSRHPAL